MTPQVYEILPAENDLSDAELTGHATRRERAGGVFGLVTKGHR